MSSDVTVIIPLGPNPPARRWLQQAVASVEAQTVPAKLRVIVDGGRHLTDTRAYHLPWNIGWPSAYNVGVGLCDTKFHMYLASDDWLAPDAVQECLATYARVRDDRGFYWLPTDYHCEPEIPSNEYRRGVQRLASGQFFTTVDWWRELGGFPVESVVGAADAWIVELLLRHPRWGTMYEVGDGRALYTHREHANQWTITQTYRWSHVVQPSKEMYYERMASRR